MACSTCCEDEFDHEKRLQAIDPFKHTLSVFAESAQLKEEDYYARLQINPKDTETAKATLTLAQTNNINPEKERVIKNFSNSTRCFKDMFDCEELEDQASTWADERMLKVLYGDYIDIPGHEDASCCGAEDRIEADLIKFEETCRKEDADWPCNFEESKDQVHRSRNKAYLYRAVHNLNNLWAEGPKEKAFSGFHTEGDRQMKYDPDAPTGYKTFHPSHHIRNDGLPFWNTLIVRPYEDETRAMLVHRIREESFGIAQTCKYMMFLMCFQFCVGAVVFGCGGREVVGGNLGVAVISFISGLIAMCACILGFFGSVFQNEKYLSQYLASMFWLFGAHTVYLFTAILALNETNDICNAKRNFTGDLKSEADKTVDFCRNETAYTIFLVVFAFVDLLCAVIGSLFTLDLLDSINDQTKLEDNRKVVQYLLVAFRDIYQHSIKCNLPALGMPPDWAQYVDKFLEKVPMYGVGAGDKNTDDNHVPLLNEQQMVNLHARSRSEKRKLDAGVKITSDGQS